MGKPEFDVEHVAGLARIALTPEEKALFAEQLPAILNYVNKIAVLNVEGIEPTLHGQPVENVFREDVVLPSLDRETALDNAPQRIDCEFKMPRIVE